jgi:hypothetical protein
VSTDIGAVNWALLATILSDHGTVVVNPAKKSIMKALQTITATADTAEFANWAASDRQ